VVKKKPPLFNKILLLVSFAFLTEVALCQEKNLSEIITSIAEELAAGEDDPEAVATYVERLQELSENPVRINSSGEDEISRLFFLSDFQVKALVDYIHSSGKVLSAFELVNIPGFDKETVELLSPFIILDNKLKVTTGQTGWRNTLITNISEKTSDRDTSYPGSSIRLLTKYKFISGNISGGLTAEKDPGERLFSGATPLPDFLSAHLAYNGKGLIRRIIVGDYSVRFGQGIRTGLSLSAPGYMAARNEIRPYTSTDENNFFRGVSAELTFKDLSLSLFYSNNQIDASPVASEGIESDRIENFYRSGLHTSNSLLKKKDVVSDLAYGINLAYNFNNFRIGVTWSEDRLSLPVIPEEVNPADLFDFTGDGSSLYTFYYSSLIKRILLFGEVSVNESFKKAVIQGVTMRPSDRLSINFLFRDYNSGYNSLHGKGPSVSSINGSERGITGNFSFEAAKHLFISGGADIHLFPWLKYRNSSPSWGTKQELRARFLPSEKLTFEALYNYRLTITDYTENKGIPQQKENIARSIKCSFRYSYNNYLTIGTRIDYKVINPSLSRGMLLSQDLMYRFKRVPVSFWLRYCLYKTDDWDSRIYLYENDLLYSFSIPALSGEGSRNYIMVKWDISDSAEIRLKYGITSLTNNNSANENKEELKFQIKIMF
jgi:hypothetical protein